MFVHEFIFGLCTLLFLGVVLKVSHLYVKKVGGKISKNEKKSLCIFLAGASCSLTISLAFAFEGWLPFIESAYNPIAIFYGGLSSSLFSFIVFTIWVCTYDFIVKKNPKQRISKNAYVSYGIFSLTIMVLLTSMTVQGLAREDIKYLHLSKIAAKIDTGIHLFEGSHKQVKELYEKLGLLAENYSHKHELEVAGLGETEIEGKRSVAKYLFSVSDSFSRVHEELSSAVKDTDEKLLQYKTEFNSLNLSNVKDFEKNLFALNKISDKLESLNHSESSSVYIATNSFEGLKDIIYTVGLFRVSNVDSIAELQRAALKKHNTEFNNDVTELSNQGKKIENQKKFAIPHSEFILSEVTFEAFTKWQDLILHWILAICMEFWPLLFLLMTERVFREEKANLEKSQMAKA